jgi:hypothetical protein
LGLTVFSICEAADGIRGQAIVFSSAGPQLLQRSSAPILLCVPRRLVIDSYPGIGIEDELAACRASKIEHSQDRSASQHVE